MLNLKKSLLSASLFASLAVPGYAGIVVNSPSGGATVSTTFTLSASASTCSSQPVGAMGYSLDSSTNTTTVSGQTLNKSVSTSAGGHTVHVKAWGTSGSSCVADVAITASASSSSSVIPSYAVSVSSVQSLSGWSGKHDAGTPGSATGSMKMTGSPSRSGNSRQFYTTYASNGGERYHVSFADDESATHFVYETWVYLDGSATNLANLEMDLNQVTSNGNTIIFGFQCDGWTGTWDYTYNKGTTSKPVDTWGHSSQSCNPRNWTRNAWHHIQVYYSRNDTGWVTYHWVSLDGKQQDINVTAYSQFALGWGPTILTNLQVDGKGSSGSVNLYVDELTVHRW